MSYAEKRVIGFSNKQIFDVVSTVAEYPRFVPWCKSVVTKNLSNRIAEYELFIGFPPFHEHYTSRVTLLYPHVIHSVCKDGRLFHYLDTTWRFGPSPPNFDSSCSCVLYFSLEFEFKSLIHAHLSSIFFAQIVRKMVSAFLSRAEELYGPSSIRADQQHPYMVLKNLARIAIAGVEAVGKAFARAVREEVQASKNMAQKDAPSTSTSQTTKDQSYKATINNARLGISLQESMQILDLKQPLDLEEINKKYAHLFSINAKKNGGTLYIQSKVYRAKERLDAELLLKENLNKEDAS